MSEVRRGLIRIGSNYGRLGIGLVMALVTVRVLLDTITADGYALVVLAGASIGFAAMAQTIVQKCLIRELGAAYHSTDKAAFSQVYSSAFLLTSTGAAVNFGLYLLLLFFLPWINVPESMLPAARSFIVAKAFHSSFIIFSAPTYNMYVITERMVAHNFWAVLNRAVLLMAALLLYVVPVESHDAVAAYGWISAALAILVQAIACTVRVVEDRRLIPRLRDTRLAAAWSMLRLGGWNAMVQIASTLHVRVSTIMVSILLGLVPWNALFGFAVQLGSYIFQLGGGVAQGSEAVAARMSTTGEVALLRKLVYHSTRLHGLVAFPGLAVMLILPEPVLWVWVGDRIENAQVQLPMAATMLQILALGFTAKAVAHGWIGIFYGAGHISRYAPIILAGGMCNPLLALALFWMLPESVRYTAMAWAFSVVGVVAYGILAPLRCVGSISLAPRDLYLPLLRPAVVAAVCSPVLVSGNLLIETWNVWNLGLVGTAYSVLYAVLGFFFIANRWDRRRLLSAVGRIVGSSRSPEANIDPLEVEAPAAGGEQPKQQ